jgi:hypothetical protein
MYYGSCVYFVGVFFFALREAVLKSQDITATHSTKGKPTPEQLHTAPKENQHQNSYTQHQRKTNTRTATHSTKRKPTPEQLHTAPTKNQPTNKIYTRPTRRAYSKNNYGIIF